MDNQVKTFRATLEPLAMSLIWVVARVPFDIKAAWPKLVRLRVQIELAGQCYRTALFPYPAGGHCVVINKKMQQAADVDVGDVIDLCIAPDLEPRPDNLPAELAKLLRSEKALAKWFATNSEAMRREIGKWVADPKTPAARQRRAEQMAEGLMLAMEAETTLPPMLERAFRAQPAARRGWEAMTANQRRNYLLGLFYRQTPEAQQKRLKALLEDAVKRGDKLA